MGGQLIAKPIRLLSCQTRQVFAPRYNALDATAPIDLAIGADAVDTVSDAGFHRLILARFEKLA